MSFVLHHDRSQPIHRCNISLLLSQLLVLSHVEEFLKLCYNLLGLYGGILMDLAKIRAVDGKCINVIIEIPFGVVGAKYEFDETAQVFFLDRILNTPMHYPCSYGFIPNTKGGDGDPLDVLVVCDTPLALGVVVAARPIGVLIMEDEKGPDEKILAVVDCDLSYKTVTSYNELSDLVKQIEYFFTHYKDLDKGKWAKVSCWREAAEAWKFVNTACVAA